MAFPTTSVLDSFNAGASQALSARAGWSATDHVLGSGDLTTDSVPTKASGQNKGNAWGTSFTDAEVWGTFSDVPNPNYVILVARWNTAAQNGYRVSLFQTSFPTFDFILFRVDGGSGVNLGSVNRTFSNGDSFGLSCIGSTITSYYKLGAGAWTLSTTVTDSTYSSAGVIGVQTNDSVFTLDSFGGGEVVTGPPASPRFVAGWSTRSGGY